MRHCYRGLIRKLRALVVTPLPQLERARCPAESYSSSNNCSRGFQSDESPRVREQVKTCVSTMRRDTVGGLRPLLPETGFRPRSTSGICRRGCLAKQPLFIEVKPKPQAQNLEGSLNLKQLPLYSLLGFCFLHKASSTL